MEVHPRPFFDNAHQPYIDAVQALPAPDSSGSIFEQFSVQATRFPEKVAVTGDVATLTYGELRTLAGRVAHGLGRAAPDTQAPVALLFDDQGMMIAAMLGVLQSGRPYLILDPAYPASLLEFMLQDSTAATLITQGEARDVLKADATSRRLLEFEGLVQADADEVTVVEGDSSGAALLLYTSGSTGRPLGIMHSHANIFAEVRDNTEYLQSGSRDVWLQYASPSFASALRSTYGALLNGATLVIHDLKRNGFLGLTEKFDSCGVTIYRSLPTTFRHYIKALGQDKKFSSVRIVSLGGETITPTDVALFNIHFEPHCVFATSYGPSECLGTFLGFIRHGTKFTGARVPMGYARPKKSVAILDDNDIEVANGVTGEITVTGRFIANSYWCDTEVSANRFRVNPDGSCTFRTGDLGVQDAMGTVTHMGRKDFQVKIRGHRVDLSEIEQYIRDVSGVDEAVVLATVDANDELRLVAYVAGREQGPELAGEIEHALKSKLPQYKLPAFIKLCDSFPLNPNGKIDRKALGARKLGWVSDTANGLPCNDTQKAIAKVWSEVLGIDNIYTGVSFLEYGGDSLTAAQAARKLSDRFGVQLPFQELLTAKGIEQIDRKLGTLRGTDG